MKRSPPPARVRERERESVSECVGECVRECVRERVRSLPCVGVEDLGSGVKDFGVGVRFCVPGWCPSIPGDRLRVGGVPREQKMLKGHLPRVISPSILVYED